MDAFVLFDNSTAKLTLDAIRMALDDAGIARVLATPVREFIAPERMGKYFAGLGLTSPAKS